MLLLVAILIPLIIVFYYKKKNNNAEFWKYIMEIPGPKDIPILGTEYKLLSPEEMFVRDRKRMRKFFPIYKTWLFDIPFVSLASPEDIELILGSTANNTKSFIYNMLSDWMGSSLLTSDGPKWHKRRKILTPAFHFNILQKFVPILTRECDELIKVFKDLSDEHYIEVMKHLTEFALNSIGETSLGISFRENVKADEYKKATRSYGAYFLKRCITPWLHIPIIYKFSETYRKTTETVKILHDFSENIIAERIKLRTTNKNVNLISNTRLALLDLMLEVKDNGGDIDDVGIREELDTFIAAGHDTTAVSLTHTLMVLANEQDIQEEMYQEILAVTGDSESPSYNDLVKLKFTERCIKESLRLFPSVGTFSRTLLENCKTKSGYTIPKGCNVNIQVYDMHRSPEVWENPNKFDPDRFLPDNIAKKNPYAYLPFSAGSRNCIGQKFAMLEMKIVLCGVLKNFKLEPIDRPEDLSYTLDLIIKPSRDIRVKFIPRI